MAKIDNNKFDEAAYQKEYAKINYKHFHLKINKREKAILKKLESQKNKNQYIIGLIKKDL